MTLQQFRMQMTLSRGARYPLILRISELGLARLDYTDNSTRLTLLCKVQKPTAMRTHRRYVEMLLSDPAVDPHLLRQHFITLNVLLVLTLSPGPMQAFHFPPFAPAGASGDCRRRRDSRGEGLGVQPIHDQFLHTFFGVVKFAVRDIPPHLTHGHFVRDESQEITDDLHLLMHHPLPFTELIEKRTKEFGYGVGSAVA